ncbi:MAG: small basic protein [Candidatus Omnitrophica bacterium]|nr:small basic protein [Candidatus Omnitrophota bacterium]
MTQHPSLKGSKEDGKFRSVLKRYEKVKELSQKEKWEEEKDSVYRLPKIKRIKFKVKKTKGLADEEGAEGEGKTEAVESKSEEGKPQKKESKK